MISRSGFRISHSIHFLQQSGFFSIAAYIYEVHPRAPIHIQRYGKKNTTNRFLLSRQGKGGSLVEQDFRNSKEGPLKKRLKKAFWNDVIDQGEDEALVVAKKKNIFFQEDPLLIQREMVALPKPSKHKKNRHKHIEEKKDMQIRKKNGISRKNSI